MAAFKSEAAMFRVLVPFLAEGWDVYQEVKVGGCTADVVAVERESPGRVWVIEGKLSRGFAVFEQAASWRPFAHRVSVAVPIARERYGATMRALAGVLGVGVLEVELSTVTEVVGARLFRRPPRVAQLRGCLAPEQRSGEFAQAGCLDGRRFSPWVATCRGLEAYVHNVPGCLLVDAMRAIVHHYPSSSAAVSAMTGWLRAGRVRGVVMRKEAGRLRLFPTTERLTPLGLTPLGLTPLGKSPLMAAPKEDA